MLVERQVSFVIAVLLVVTVEPMREIFVQMTRLLAKLAPAQRRSAFPGTVGDHHRKPCVFSPGPQCRFTEA
jgi:hypothetical protein